MNAVPGVSAAERLSFLDGLDESRNAGGTNDEWLCNNSPFERYFDGVSFQNHQEGPLQIIESQLEGLEHNVGIDIAGGANGVALRGLIKRQGLLEKGLVTNKFDTRDGKAQDVPELDHIDGNILLPETWEKILGWQRKNCPEGASLLMHRPVGGLQRLPTSFYMGAVHLGLDMVRPRGLAYIQIPKKLLGHRHGRRDNLRKICSSIDARDDVAKVIRPERMLKKRCPSSSSTKCAIIIKK